MAEGAYAPKCTSAQGASTCVAGTRTGHTASAFDFYGLARAAQDPPSASRFPVRPDPVLIAAELCLFVLPKMYAPM